MIFAIIRFASYVRTANPGERGEIESNGKLRVASNPANTREQAAILDRYESSLDFFNRAATLIERLIADDVSRSSPFNAELFSSYDDILGELREHNQITRDNFAKLINRIKNGGRPDSESLTELLSGIKDHPLGLYKIECNMAKNAPKTAVDHMSESEKKAADEVYNYWHDRTLAHFYIDTLLDCIEDPAHLSLSEPVGDLEHDLKESTAEFDSDDAVNAEA